MLNARWYVALLCLPVACARPYPPPGGEQDKTPPRLAAATPEALAVLPDFNGPVVFQFDERLSERGFSEALVVVSPLDGAIRVDRGRREVSVELDGGWRPNRVYRVILLPGLRDLFGNARTESVELVFSTGPPVPSTAIGGIVQDRLTERAAQNAIVTALRRADSVSYMALADSGGFFALRHLPLGVYELRAYGDQNRNRRHDPTETVDSGRVVSLGAPADTLTELFSVLAPDSTAARLRSAEPVDSLHIRLSFDDYLNPAAPPAPLTGQLSALPDSTPFARVVEAIHPTAFEQQRRARAPVDTTRPVADTTTRRVQLPTRTPTETPILPSRDLIVRIEQPLRADTEYVVTIANVSNINGLSGGGGSARFRLRPPPVAPPVRRDTLTLRPSS